MSSARPSDACPLCGRPVDPAVPPFCSRGCRDRDLLNWLGDAYALPGKELPNGVDSDRDPPL